jgi:membrane dipeptidase
VIADAHLDLLLELAHRELRDGETGTFARHWLPNLRAGGVRLQVCSLYSDPGADARREVLHQIEVYERAVQENAEAVVAVRSRADLDDSRLRLLLALEGCEPLGGDPEALRELHALGVRMLSLTWNLPNAFASGTADPDGPGLTARGRELLAAMEELGVALDLAHASERTFWQALEAFSGPVLVSHAACRALNDHPRNLSDEQLRALAKRDGVLGLMLIPLAIDPESPTLARACDHAAHAAELMGAQGVALGGDFMRQIARVTGTSLPPEQLLTAGPLGAAIEGLAGPEDYPALVAALRERGWEGERLAGLLGGNLLRLLGRALPE